MKALGIVRVSTQLQEMQSQKEELITFIKSDGWKDEDIIIIEGKGASAIKLDDLYLYNINLAKEYIASGEVACVYAWMLDRIGRNEEVMMNFKNFLIQHGTNLKIKNPSLYLLDSDGKVNSGMEIAISLFTTMAKQEMEVKKERFKRGKKRIASEGKYIGGGTLRYGYSIDEHGFLIENKEEADIIRLIYTLYCTGKYSLSKLRKELEERGLEGFHEIRLNRILRTKAYIGGEVGKNAPIHYSRLISDELFEKAQTILDSSNTRADKNSKHHYFGSKITFCGDCGSPMIASTECYICWGRMKKECDGQSAYISIEFLDGLLFQIASSEHLLFMAKNSESEAESIENEISIHEQKKSVLESQKSAVNEKIERAKKLYMKGLMDDKELDGQIAKIKREDEARIEGIRIHEDKIAVLYSKIQMLKSQSDYEDLLKLWDGVLSEEDEEKKRDIVRMHIERVEINRVDSKIKEITITMTNGKVRKFEFYFHNKKGKRLFEVKGNKREHVLEFYVKR